MTRERIIERVRKLLALSNSSNEHEAALAAAHAQRLLAEHNLAMSELEMQEEGAGEVELKVAKTVPKWLSSLFATVANAFDCFPIVTTNQEHSRLRFIGVGEDPGVAACTLQYLIKELRRLASGYLSSLELRDARLPAADRQRIRTSYLLGGVHGVRQAMTAQKAQTPTTSKALVPVKDALIRQYREEHVGELRTRRSRSSTVVSEAFHQGRQDGASLQLNPGLKTLPEE
ncbi:DUF2786 domain-containing protein [Trichlorobacter lovleyi]|uniref:DUF7168 domain-containing protein n=1 Tax=Trichlorobacter lovleyi TaxID=313985 RepID=UPI00223FB1C7|nr:DUF2786 domain-containing protein [Trichlorobacter lovleyi]QOX77747.1 DUF2786 domain-containing protein [Trichlorobacter lovleyi]